MGLLELLHKSLFTLRDDHLASNNTLIPISKESHSITKTLQKLLNTP